MVELVKNKTKTPSISQPENFNASSSHSRHGHGISVTISLINKKIHILCTWFIHLPWFLGQYKEHLRKPSIPTHPQKTQLPPAIMATKVLSIFTLCFHFIIVLSFVATVIHSSTLESDIKALRSLKHAIDPTSISPTTFLSSWDWTSWWIHAKVMVSSFWEFYAVIL